jgi:hypothetical protein
VAEAAEPPRRGGRARRHYDFARGLMRPDADFLRGGRTII